MKQIEAFQIKKIYAIANTLGLVESGSHHDELHELISGIAGKDSVKALTYREAAAVIMRLEQLQGDNAPPKRKQKKEHTEVPGGVTQDQQKKVWALMYELKKFDETPSPVPLGDRLCGIIQKEFQVTCLPKNPFVWLKFSDGKKLIEILKRYVASAKRKGA